MLPGSKTTSSCDARFIPALPLLNRILMQDLNYVCPFTLGAAGLRGRMQAEALHVCRDDSVSKEDQSAKTGWYMLQLQVDQIAAAAL